MKKRLIFDYIKACVNLYGIVSVEEVVRIYNLQQEDKIDASSIAIVMETKTLKNSFMVFQEGSFISKAIMEFDHVEFILGHQKGKPPYVPEQAELLRYKDPDYIQERSQYADLKRFVAKEFKLDSNIANRLCEELHVLCFSSVQFEEYYEELARWGVKIESENQMKRFVAIMVPLINHTRTWLNKGYTPTELSELMSKQKENVAKSSLGMTTSTSSSSMVSNISQTKKIAIGRNDMCYCGSNKKYKKCCGAN